MYKRQDLDRLPQSERARWCVWKSVELLYLLSAPEEPAAEMAPGLDQELTRTCLLYTSRCV